MLNSTGIPHPAAVRNPLAPYRVFVGTVDRGPHAGTTFTGPIVLGYDGRIQVIGYFFPQKGGRVLVVGTDFGGAANLRFNLPQGGALEATGSGQLQSVRGGLPDGLSLVGKGLLSGPANADVGHWVTLPASKVGGA